MAKKKRRADGRMEIKRKMPDGSVRHFLGRTAAECEKKYRDALVNFEARQRARAEGPLFGVLADEWWAAKEGQIRHGTVRCYKPAVARLKKALGDLPAAQLTAQEVSRLLEDMKRRGLATKTISNTHTVLNMILEYGAVEYGLTSNPSRLVSTPTSRKKKRKPPSEPAEQAIRSLLNQAAASQKVDDAILIGAVLLYTGCRRGEALALRFGDIDRQTKRIKVAASVEHRGNRPVVGSTKTDSGVRVVPLLPQLEGILDAYGWRAAGRYVLGGGPDPLTNRQFSNRWIDFCRRMGLAESSVHERKGYGRNVRTVRHTEYKALVTPHQFRHWFATDLYKAGVPMDVAVRMLGHADSEMIRRVYLNVDAELLDQGGALLAEYMSGKVS